jgi:hypothetical protein
MTVAAVACAAAWGSRSAGSRREPSGEPDLPEDATPTVRRRRSAAARRVSAFLGRIAASDWEVEVSTLPQSASGLRALLLSRPDGERYGGPPLLQVMRHRERLDGRGTLLRVATFFPGATVADLEPRLMDAEARRRWDCNYLYGADFVTLPVGDDATPGENATVVCDLRTGFEAVSRNWRGHVVGSPALGRLGVRPRSFLYDRTAGRRAQDGAVCCVYRGLSPLCASGDEDRCVVEGASVVRRPWVCWGDALARAGWVAASSPPTSADAADAPAAPAERAAGVPGERLAEALRAAFLAGPATGTEEAAMFWQEQLLLPVKRCDLRHAADGAEPTTALQRAVQRLCTECDPFASSAADALGPNGVGADGESDVVGTLMVVTSCNDAKTPALPRFVERFGARRLAVGSASWLLADLATH